MRLFKKKYLDAVKKRHLLTDAEFEEVTSVPAHKCGRKLLLGEQLDVKVQSYVKALRSAGTTVGSSIVMAAATGIISAHDRTLLVEFGGYICISKSCAISLLKRLGYLKRKATAKSTPCDVWRNIPASENWIPEANRECHQATRDP